MKEAALRTFADDPFVGEYRQTGMAGACEGVKDKETKEPFPSRNQVGYQIYKFALEKGLLLRRLGNILYFMPLYVMTKEEIDCLMETDEDLREFFKTYPYEFGYHPGRFSVTFQYPKKQTRYHIFLSGRIFCR